MFENTIRNFYILSISIFSYFKLLNIPPKNKLTNVILLLFSVSTSFLFAFLFKNHLSINWIIMLFSFFLAMIFMTSSTVNTSVICITVLFSFILSFISFCLSAIATASCLLPFYYKTYEVPWIIIRTTAGFIHFFLIFLCFKIPRLRKGMIFLYHIPLNNVGSAMCILLFLFLIILCQTHSIIESFFLKTTAITFIFTFLLIYWWNYHITQTYLKFSKNNTLDTLSLLLEEKEQQIAYLKSENDKLARIIHKDNKILPALCMALPDVENQTAGFMAEEEQEQTTLHAKLRQLYEERKETLENYQKEILRLPQTAFDSVNALLSYMQAEAGKAGAGFGVVLSDNLSSTIPAEISEDDFTHVLSDLLANAVNACRGINGTDIRVTMGKAEHMSVLTVRNTGQLFAPEVLQDLGKRRHTTHADTGGSGIGLMDIWEIKKRYRATLLIEETLGTAEQLPSVTIRLLFNHKNHYIIQSERSKELTAIINRPNVMIMARD